MKPLLSLVVLAYQNFDGITRPCLESLLPWREDPDIEMLVVDNCSADGSAQKLLDWQKPYAKIQSHLSTSNLGFSAGMNLGVSHAKGDWVLLVNNDTLFPAQTLDALKRVILDAPNEVAMIGPVTNAAGNGQRLWKPGASTEQWLEIGEWLNTHPSGHLMPTYRCDFFCIAIRQSVWKGLNGLDPVFGLGYFEDFDFSLRLAQAGYQQRITEDVFVFHAGSASFKTNPAAKALMKRNKKIMKDRHTAAKFEHTRLGNLEVLKDYEKLKLSGKWSTELEARRQLRVGALLGDSPRSFFKKLLWKKKTQTLIYP
jgi:GT2 family glycosyltransferase